MPISAAASAPSTAAAVPSAPPPAINRELRRGLSGEDVRELQRLLGTHGHPVDLVGHFGPATEAAVRAFQSEQGIGVDGVVGPITLGRLLNPPASVSVDVPASTSSAAPVDVMDATPPPPSSVIGSSSTTTPPPATPPVSIPSVASVGLAPGIYQTQGGAIRVRDDATADTLRQQGPEYAALVDTLRAEGFFPVRMSDGSHIFMSNPTYAPDTNGLGVSSNEARAYAAAHGLRLPTRAEADAFRAQAPVVVQFEAGPTPGTSSARTATEQQARNAARLAAVGIPESGVAIAGATKIWALEGGRVPGLNGAVTNVQTGAALQGYSTVHGPDYEDYSQAGQFVHPTRVKANGTIVP